MHTSIKDKDGSNNSINFLFLFTINQTVKKKYIHTLNPMFMNALKSGMCWKYKAYTERVSLKLVNELKW